MAIRHWTQLTGRPFLLTVLTLNLLLGCVSKGNIAVPASQPAPHPMLSHMQSLALKEKDQATQFGKSRKYFKNGIQVVVLEGTPYEIGFARGALLHDDIREWVTDLIFTLKKKSFGTSYGEKQLIRRAREVEEFIPAEYREELQGLSAGSDIDYDLLVVLNILAPIIIDVSCASVVIQSSDGGLLRSRNLDLYNAPVRPAGLYFHKPTSGHAFVSISHLPGFIGTRTAFNESGLSIGAHDISRPTGKYVKGEPEFILRRKVAQYASSVNEAGQILKSSKRSGSKMWLVADPKTAGVYEFNSQEFAYYEMVDNQLILTNHTRMLDIGKAYQSSFDRYDEAKAFLDRHRGQMNMNKLIELNRGSEICWRKNPNITNLHSAIFRADTLDFWLAAGPPPATIGSWVGFNLRKEIYGVGNDPDPLIIPAVN